MSQNVDFASITLERLRQDFPILKSAFNGQKLVYLDNAATTQKPQVVIDSISNFYAQSNSNIHRSSYPLAEIATEKYEQTRNEVQTFLNAKFREEIIFTSGTTAGINLIAGAFGKTLKPEDEIIISQMEHHSNFLPWQQLALEKDLLLKIIEVNEKGELDLENYQNLLSSKTKLVAITHVSNTLGTINPIEQMIKMAKKTGAAVLIDAAQSVLVESLNRKEEKVLNMQKLNCDFCVFSAHKMFGPTGLGLLYAKKDWLEKLEPTQFGGAMVDLIGENCITWASLPYKWEAGTPNIAAVVGFGATLDYLQDLSKCKLALNNQVFGWQEWEIELLKYTTEKLQSIPNLQIYGHSSHKLPIISFKIKGINSYDIATLFGQYNICVRSGSHCTQPLLQKLQVQDLVRVSPTIYNTFEEIDLLAQKLEKVLKILQKV